MIDVQKIVEMQCETVTHWHTQPIDNPCQGFLADVCKQHSFNYQLWHEEDIARSPDANDSVIARVKRAIDGFNQQDVTLTSLRKQIAMVPQSSLMMRASVRENIAVARPNASLEEIMESAQLAQAHDFIMKMPGGYSSMIEERAANISGGQRQRLCLARAFLQRAPILVLDEATSALDVEAERVIMDNVDTHFDNCTVLMIAHRLSTVRKADKIVVLNRGMIAEQGTHGELMDHKGLYYALNGRQQAAE